MVVPNKSFPLNPIKSQVDKSKISKIKYKLNLLPEISMHAILKGG